MRKLSTPCYKLKSRIFIGAILKFHVQIFSFSLSIIRLTQMLYPYVGGSQPPGWRMVCGGRGGYGDSSSGYTVYKKRSNSPNDTFYKTDRTSQKVAHTPSIMQ